MDLMYDLRKGDCFELMKELDDNSIDLIITDPPYGISGTTPGSVKTVGFYDYMKDLDKANISSGYDIVKFGNEALRVLKAPKIYLWCNKLQIPEYLDFWVKEKRCKFDILCWHKSNAVPTYSGKYMCDTEYCLFFHRDCTSCAPQSYDDGKTWYTEPINMRDKELYDHPTVKPVKILERLVRNSSKEDDLILDPFMGSGSTGVACLYNRRRFLGMELVDKYFEVAQDRLAKSAVDAGFQQVFADGCLTEADDNSEEW